jgi:DNA-binding XRE family transcriptional regulator
MSRLAFINRLRGRRTIRSSWPQPAVSGNFGIADAVMSMPMAAKSPLSSSQMSGQPSQATLCVPLACGSGPRRRRNAIGALITNQHSVKAAENARTKYSVYAVVRICGFGFAGVMPKIPKYRKVLGENIRTHRRKLGWSQIKLAERASLHHNYIGDVERGEENVSVDALMRIATALKVTLSDLVQGV